MLSLLHYTSVTQATNDILVHTGKPTLHKFRDPHYLLYHFPLVLVR